MVLSAWPPYPSDIYFTYNPQVLIDLKYVSMWQFRFKMTDDNDHL